MKAVDEPMLMRARMRLIRVERPTVYKGRAVRDSTCGLAEQSVPVCCDTPIC